jgi:prepilin-type processing-associated H-X9-DG protein
MRHNNGQITGFVDGHVAYSTTPPNAPFPPGTPVTLSSTLASVSGNNAYINSWAANNQYAWSTNTLAGNGFVAFNIDYSSYGLQLSAGIIAANANGTAVPITNESQMLACVRLWGVNAQVYGAGSYGGGKLLWTDSAVLQSTDMWYLTRTGSTVNVMKNSTVVATIPNISGPVEFACYLAASQKGIENITMSTY